MGPRPRPYDGKTDQDLSDSVKAAAAAAADEEAGPAARARWQAAHDSMVNELKRRLVLRVNQELGLPDVEVPEAGLSGLELPPSM